MIKNKEEIVRNFCKDALLERSHSVSKDELNPIMDNTRKKIISYSWGDITLRHLDFESYEFFKINTYFINMDDECSALEDSLCIRHIEYNKKTGVKEVYYGIPKMFIYFLAGYSIEDSFILNMVNNLYIDANTFYSNRYHVFGEESPIRYEGSSFGLEDDVTSIYCPLTIGVGVCYGDMCGIDSCMECEYMNVDFVPQHIAEELALEVEFSSDSHEHDDYNKDLPF